MSDHYPHLVGDVGGTHARFAIATRAADGSITLPLALRPYMGGMERMIANAQATG